VKPSMLRPDLLLLLLAVSVQAGGGGGHQGELGQDSCHTVCTCNLASRSVACRNTNLDDIPNDLDPRITKLSVTGHSRIQIVNHMQAYTRLEQLDLSHNGILDIQRGCFDTSSSIGLLNLGYNKLGSVDWQDLHGLTSAININLTHNEIDNVTGAFSSCRSLQTLDLSHNKLVELEVGSLVGLGRGGGSRLRELYLSHNLLQEVPGPALAPLSELTVLDLSRNQLQTLRNRDFEVFGTIRLRELKLSGCLLHTLADHSMAALKFLTRLDLSNNLLDRFPNALNNLFSLEELELGRNRIHRFESGDFEGLHNLRVFRLTGCHGDGLSLEAGLFRLNTNLEQLVLRCPGLTSIPPRLRLGHLSVLKQLDLHGSGLTSLPAALLPYTDLALLDISVNPLHCDCRLSFLARAGPTRLVGSCVSPASQAGKQLADLSAQDLCEEPPDESSVVTVLSVAAAVAVSLIALGLICWWKRPWDRSQVSRRKRKKSNFSGSKADIKVVQNPTEPSESHKFIQLAGLETYSGVRDSRPLSGSSSEGDPVYATVSETVPEYNIPLGPDVKISVI